MRFIPRLSHALFRPAGLAFGCSLGFALFAQAALAQPKPVPAAQEAPAAKQTALNAKQIDGVLAAKKDMDAIIAKIPDNAGDKPDPKIVAQLDAAAKKYDFVNYAEYSDVTDSIGLVMGGFDPETKKYVGQDAVIKKEIAEVRADKQMTAKDKKEALDELNESLKAVTPVQFPANIELVGKYYDKLAALMPSD